MSAGADPPGRDAMASAALAIAVRRIPVFPCDPSSKKPLVPTGFKAATTDVATIGSWWRRWPGAMIGMPTGERSGLVVLDVDRDAGKAVDGFAALAALEARHGPLPETRTQRTPRGGEHRFFAWPGSRTPNSASKLGPGLDVRGDGGYVILAPSVTANGVAYELTRDIAPIAAPTWLLPLMQADKVNANACGIVPQGGRPHRDLSRYAAAALIDECRDVKDAAAGRRNEQLNRAAFKLGQLVGAGALERERVEGALFGAATASGLVRDDGESSVRRTIRSGLQAGVADPRDLPQSVPRTAERPHLRSGTAGDLAGFERTEDGIALAFAEAHAQDLRFCHQVGKWYVWTGSRWQKEETKLAFHWARELCRALNAKSDHKLGKAATAASVERFAQADRTFAVTSDIWDADPFLLGTPAGAVDLRDGSLRPAEREDFITRQAAVAPDPAAGRPLWSRFLAEATLGDVGLQRFLQQVAGYCLTGDIREHALFFVYGSGGNGKSVFLNVLAGIMGDYATTAAMDSFTASATDRHPTDLAMLQGARMVSASETEEGRAWAESRIKQMTGGDTIRARYMRQDFFEYRPQFKLMIVGNHKPILRNLDDAARRRFNIIPFVHRPPNPDKTLEARLKTEWPAILAWAIQGALDWQQHGLVRPAVVTAATEAYFAEQDIVRQWVTECCNSGGRELSDTTANLFASWSVYAQANGEKPGTTKRFSQILQRHGYRPVTETPGHRKKRGFLGIAAKPVDTSQQWQPPTEERKDAPF